MSDSLRAHASAMRNLLSQWKLISLHVSAIIVTIFLFMGRYLLSGGYIIYRDLFWPYSSNLLLHSWSFFDPGLINVNLGQSDPTGFFRIVLTWPLAILALFHLPSAAIEVIFFIYLFCFVYVALYLATRGIDKITQKTMPEALRILIIIVMASNFYALQTVTWYSLWLGFALLALLATRLLNWLLIGDRIDLCLALAVWIFLSLLDIRFLIWSPILFVIVTIMAIITDRDRISLAAKRSLQTLGLFIFAVAPLYLSLYLLNVISGNVVANGISILSSPETYLSRAPSLIDAIRLLGYWDPTIKYVAPLPILKGLWISSTFIVPTLLAIAVLIRRKAAIAFVLMGLVGLDLSLGSYSPLNVLLFTVANHFGGIWNLIYFPFLPTYYSLILLACGYSLCFYIICSHIVSTPCLKARKYIAFAIVFGLIGLQLFASWQFFNGSVYPSGSVGPGSEVTDPTGVLQPSNPPLAVQNAYSWLEKQSGSSNTLWIPGTFGYAYTWNNKSSPFNEYYSSPAPFVDLFFNFPFSSSSNLTSTLDAYHVRFVVVQNDVEPIASTNFYGANVSEIISILQSNGLELIGNYSNIVLIYLNPSAPDYISCNPNQSNSAGLIDSTSWTEVEPFYWTVDVAGNGSQCSLTFPLKADNGWIVINDKLETYNTQNNEFGLLQFSVGSNSDYTVIYFPYFFALSALLSVWIACLVFIFLILTKKSLSWAFKFVVLTQFAFYSIFFAVGILLHDPFAIATSSVLAIALAIARIIVGRQI